jgi:hypothetical protein
LNFQLRILYIPRDRPSLPATRLGARVGFSFVEIVYFTDKSCPEMRKRNARQVILTPPTSKTHSPQTPYKTLILTRLLKETTVPLTLSVLPHKLAQTLPLKERALTAFPCIKTMGRGQ